jgi:hypothetical protein
MKSKEIKILLAAPRGFCAGVERAIEIVKKSINKYGAPVYVRHEIVHNKHVVDGLKEIGAPYLLILFFTISIARSTPAQKPRGAASKILISLLFIFF